VKKFRFHLQTVLDVREEKLKEAQLAFAIEEQKRMAIVHQIETAQAGIHQSFADYNVLLDSGQLPVLDSRQFSLYIQRQRQKITGYTHHLKEQENQMAVAREALRLAKVQHRSIELLKEKHWKRYLKEIHKQEEEVLSEIALNQYRKARVQAS